ncbi:MAG: DegT/DnrJ/EryC1/StrS family aminotransferase [Planctomycetota bacterium]
MPALAQLARFGGRPRFDRVRPIGQLSVPDRERFRANMRELYAGGASAGSLGLVQRLERELAALHGVEACVAYSNACVALIALTELVAVVPGGEVILPAFTYMGLPHLVQWTGHRPRFCDVHPTEHTLDVDAVRACIRPNTAAILGVHQVNATCRVEALDALSRETGVPVIYDAVHGFYNTHRGAHVGSFGRAEVFSLHATKMLNGFEGGYVTTNDLALAEDLRALRNHGLGADGRPQRFGLHGGLSEVHAGFALAGIPEIAAACARNLRRYERYRAGLAGLPGLSVVPYPEDGERRNYEFTLVWVDAEYGLERDQVVEVLLAEGTRARAYYGPPVHLTDHRPDDMPAPSLPVTEHLARHIIQMPVGEHVSLEDIDEICAVLRTLHEVRDAARAGFAARSDAEVSR